MTYLKYATNYDIRNSHWQTSVADKAILKLILHIVIIQSKVTLSRSTRCQCPHWEDMKKHWPLLSVQRNPCMPMAIFLFQYKVD